MKAFIKKNTWLTRSSHLDFGWGNGYVAIPKGHELYGRDYNTIDELIPTLYIHGGLTFSDYAKNLGWKEIPKDCQDCWVVGFDTCHYSDTIENWSEQKVLIEAEYLKSQLEQY